MKCFASLTVVSLSMFSCVCSVSALQAQVVSDLPRAEYYVANALFGGGRLFDARGGYETAFSRGRRVGDARWVDSIPPLVMLGECDFQQGNLAAALTKYNSALSLLVTHSDWIDQLEVPVEQAPELDNISKGINWFRKSVNTSPLAIPQSIQISIDPTQAQVDAQGNVVAPVSLLTRLDATEVLRTAGLAMLRRQQILGPLTDQYPLSQSLSTLFSRRPRQVAPWVQASWSVLRGISSRSVAGADPVATLQSGERINGRFDYFLTPLALMAQAEIALAEGNLPRAFPLLQDATLIAAQFGQAATLAEAVELLGSCAAAVQRGDMIPAFQQIAIWSTKPSSRVRAAALNATGELQTLVGDSTDAARTIKQLGLVMRSGDIALPRLQAQSSYVSALWEFKQNRRPAGAADLENAVSLMRGTAQSGPIPEEVFQAQLTLDQLAAGSITSQSAERILAEVLAEPNVESWLIHPLKSLARITTSSNPAYERWLQLSTVQGDDDLKVRLVDRLQRQRLFEALPLGGRLFAWREAVFSDPNALSPQDRVIVRNALQQQPDIVANLNDLRALTADLRAGPLPVDERQLSADLKKTFSQLAAVSEKAESSFAALAVGRNALERNFPRPASFDEINATIQTGDVVVAFAATGAGILGIAIDSTQVETWEVNDVEKLQGGINKLRQGLGLLGRKPSHLPSESVGGSASWRAASENLTEMLFSADAIEMIRKTRRLILVPHDQLWYVPFEALVVGGQRPPQPLLASKAICYVPTLGSLPLAYSSRAPAAKTVGVLGKFFSKDKQANLGAAAALQAAIPNSTLLDLDQKLLVANPVWMRAKTDQLWVGVQTEGRGSAWDFSILPAGDNRAAKLSGWLETPQVSPLRVALPGLTSSTGTSTMGNGNELFLPACSLMFSGTKSALISRWPVGGLSTERLLIRYLTELDTSAASDALRRSVLALWAEDFALEAEPVLLPASNNSSPVISGQHPLLWSGYMQIGDSVDP